MPQISRTSRDDKKGLTEKNPRAQMTKLLVMTQYGSLEAERGPSQQLFNEVETQRPTETAKQWAQVGRRRARSGQGRPRLLLTVMAFHGININRGIEFPRTEEPRKAEEVAGAVRRCAIGAEQVAHAVILTLLVLCPLLHLHLLLLCPVHIVDAHQQAVVHDLQLGQKLGEGRQKLYRASQWQLEREENILFNSALQFGNTREGDIGREDGHSTRAGAAESTAVEGAALGKG